jgi:hypothetical protein
MAVSIENRLKAGWPRNHDMTPSSSNGFLFSPQNPNCVAHPASYTMSTWETCGYFHLCGVVLNLAHGLHL